MAKRIVTVSSHPFNPVSQLAELIQAAFEERSVHSDYFSIDFKQQLRTFAGLGFAAVMAEGSKIKYCRPLLASFLRYSILPRKKNFQMLSVAVAELVCNAMCPFKVLGYPRYYDDFLLAGTRIVDPSGTAVSETKNERQEKLLELLGAV